jgi:invasion protein IalB
LQAVAAVLIEREGETRKLLRVILPLGVKLPPGTRVIIDQNQPRTAPYVICFANGCMADYEASDELIGNMKKGQALIVQAVDAEGEVINLRLPLNDFGKAYDSPSSDPEAIRGPVK